MPQTIPNLVLEVERSFDSLNEDPNTNNITVAVHALTALATTITADDHLVLLGLAKRHNDLVAFLLDQHWFSALQPTPVLETIDQRPNLLSDEMDPWGVETLRKVRANLAQITTILPYENGVDIAQDGSEGSEDRNEGTSPGIDLAAERARTALRTEADSLQERNAVSNDGAPGDQPERTDPNAQNTRNWSCLDTTPVARSPLTATTTTDVEATDPMKKTSSEAPKTEPPSQEAVSPSVNSRLGAIIGDTVQARLEAAPPPRGNDANGCGTDVKIEGKTWGPANPTGTATRIQPPAGIPAQEISVNNNIDGHEQEETKRTDPPKFRPQKEKSWARGCLWLLAIISLFLGSVVAGLVYLGVVPDPFLPTQTATTSAPATTSASSSSALLDCTHATSIEGDLDGDGDRESYVIIPLHGGATAVSVAGITAKDGVCRWNDFGKTAITVEYFRVFLQSFKAAYTAGGRKVGPRMTDPVMSRSYTVRCNRGSSSTFDGCFTL